MNDGNVQTGEEELFTRVIQFGAFSPIYTNWGNNGSDDDLWLLPAQVSEKYYRGRQHRSPEHSRALKRHLPVCLDLLITFLLCFCPPFPLLPSLVAVFLSTRPLHVKH